MKVKITNKYMKEGIMLFLVGLALICVWFVIHNSDSLRAGIAAINDILNPFYVGIILAYLLCPIYNWVVRRVYHNLENRVRKKTRAYKIARFTATLFSVSALVAAVAGFLVLIIPDLIDSILGIIYQLPDTVNRLNNWFVENIQENPELVSLLQGNLENLTDKFLEWFQGQVKPAVDMVVSGVSVGVIGTVNLVFDGFVALIICVYVLNSKEMFQAQAKKAILALCTPQRAEDIFELGYLTNRTFGGFINGKIIDSIIIGIICFIAMSLLKLPLATLISVIVGITNVIPFFGPFIGAIPSAILLLIVDPVAALKFLILVLVLQQVDGNIIGPKILGDSTGLASFWVMFAIIVGGGLFGFAGMILGVPCFAVFYIYMTRFINNRLAAKGRPTDTAVYETFGKYKINKEDIFGKERCNPDGAGAGEPVENREHCGAD